MKIFFSLFVALLVLESALPALAQTFAQNTPKFTLQGPAEQSSGVVVRDALGRPCLDTEAAARAHVVNPNVLDHVVSVKNNCPKIIKAKICYFQSDRCVEISVPSYGRSDAVLGTMTGVRTFRYSLYQK